MIQDDNRVDQKLIDRGQSGPDRVDRTKQSLVKWWHNVHPRLDPILKFCQAFRLVGIIILGYSKFT